MKLEDIKTRLEKCKRGRWYKVTWVSSQKTSSKTGDTVTYICDGLIRFGIDTHTEIPPTNVPSTSSKIWFNHYDDDTPSKSFTRDVTAKDGSKLIHKLYPLVYHHNDASKSIDDRRNYVLMFLAKNAHIIQPGGNIAARITKIRMVYNLGRDNESFFISKDEAKKAKLLAAREIHAAPELCFLKPIDKILSIGYYYKG